MNAAYGGRPTYGWHLRRLAEVTEGPISMAEILSHVDADKSWNLRPSRRGNYTPNQERHHRRSVERALHANGWENVARGYWQPGEEVSPEATNQDVKPRFQPQVDQSETSSSSSFTRLDELEARLNAMMASARTKA